jgi:hypothetical protein
MIIIDLVFNDGWQGGLKLSNYKYYIHWEFEWLSLKHNTWC